jgi:ubiquinone/menaquinone biosynthesis C-methylase UbiE
MSVSFELPDLKMPPGLRRDQMPDLLRYWYLGTRGRRHMMLRRFSEVDAGLSCIAAAGRVLDVGSAWGFNVMALGLMGYDVVGMDLVEDQFETGAAIAGENKTAFKVAGADAARLPFADATFDAVTMVETFEHVFLEDRVTALHECCRVLRPGGVLVLSTPNYRSLVERFKRFAGTSSWLRSKLPTMCYPEEGTGRQNYHPYHYHHPLPDEDIKSMLQGAGFRDVSVSHFLFMLKNTADPVYPLMSRLEIALEKIPGVRRLAATSRFVARKP